MSIKLPKLIGHRGVRDLFPENTIISINKAIEYNFKWIEIDVKISKDKIPFLLHDEKLNRTTSGKGYPYNHKYKYIKTLDAGSWFSSKFKNIYPPTLKEIIEICYKKNIGINIELKPNKNKEKENVESILSLLKKYLGVKIFFSSFDYYSISLLRSISNNNNISFLIDSFEENKNIENIIQNCLNIKCFAVGFNIEIINKEIVKYCKKNNLFVTVYSNKSIKYSQALELWNLGVDSIFIDDPRFFKKILNY